LVLQTVTLHETVDIVNIFDADKSAGDDQISPMTVKRVIASIAEPLEYIFNSVFSNGVFHDLLKIGKVAYTMMHNVHNDSHLESIREELLWRITLQATLRKHGW